MLTFWEVKMLIPEVLLPHLMEDPEVKFVPTIILFHFSDEIHINEVEI